LGFSSPSVNVKHFLGCGASAGDDLGDQFYGFVLEDGAFFEGKGLEEPGSRGIKSHRLFSNVC